MICLADSMGGTHWEAKTLGSMNVFCFGVLCSQVQAHDKQPLEEDVVDQQIWKWVL